MAHVRRKGRHDEHTQQGRLLARTVNRARRTKNRRTIWSRAGVEPLAPNSLDIANTGDPVQLAAAAVFEAIRRPLRTDLVHLVAERLTAVGEGEWLDELLRQVHPDQAIRRDRLLALARWMRDFGQTPGQEGFATKLLGGDVSQIVIDVEMEDHGDRTCPGW